jgi:hypothetical protein
MAVITHSGSYLLPNSANKSDFYAVVDNAVVTDIVNADISATAAIADSKLDTISTAGKANITALVVSSQATGDIPYYTGTVWSRLAIGTVGQTLTVASGLPSWA